MAGSGFDGFDRNVAEKMPKIRKEEEVSLTAPSESEAPACVEAPPEPAPLEPPPKRKAIFTPQPKEGEGDDRAVLKLIEDLHAQLLVSNRTKRALEMDLVASRRNLHQLMQENKSLSAQLESLSLELQKRRQIESEIAYIEEENEDALERIASLQGEIRTAKETLAATIQERDEACRQLESLKAQIERDEVLRLKGKLKEKEVAFYSEENRDLRARLEEALRKNEELEGKYEAMKKSFTEVKESLTLLRDACKANYYNLSEGST